MKALICAAALFFPALLAAEPPQPPPQGLPPEVRAQLQREAAELEARIVITPKDCELYVKLGFTYARLEQADDAQRAFEKAITLDPKKDIAYYMLGLIYEKKGMKERAIAAWKTCLDVSQDPRLRDTAERHLHHLSRP